MLTKKGLGLILAFLLVAMMSLGAAKAQQASGKTAMLEVDLQKSIGKVSPTLYGLMTEEINYSYDGGLYAELIRNRELKAESWNAAFWEVRQNKAFGATMHLEHREGPSEALKRSLKVVIEKAAPDDQAGLENEGYWGIPVRANTEYKSSFYAKADGAAMGPVTVNLIDDNTGKVWATGKSQELTTEWKKFDVELKTGGDVTASPKNHFVLTVGHSGTVWFSLVSLFPPTYKGHANGNRIDIMEKLAAMHPKFLRFPGGNYLEGDHINERFDWKKTIGPLVDRPTHRSPWGYNSSDGMGLLEFLVWCEDLGMQPVVGVYAGYSLQQEYVKPGPDLEPYVQDVLDEIEYITGGADTKWGAVRARDGHPAPFALPYVEIGNEDTFDRSGSYDGRFTQFYDAIKKNYPQVKIIGSTSTKSRTPDVIDDHYYRDEEEFYKDTHHYDKTDRNGPKIFVGEWATMEGSPTPDFGAALSDAAWMTGLERNSDVIVMASYAPLFVNVGPGGMQWRTNLIGYDAMSSYGSPGYYAQVMFGSHLGSEIVETKLDGGGERFFYSVTKDADKGVLYVKMVNASPEPQEVELKLEGAEKIQSKATLVTLKAKTKEDTNSIGSPRNVVPVMTPVEGVGKTVRRIVPGYAIQVLEIKVQ